MSQAQRSAKSSNWGTPVAVVDAVRQCLGGDIQFDPCSSLVHQEVVRASYWCGLDVGSDGLLRDWAQYSTVFCNPPGSARGVQPWWDKFQDVRRGIWLGFNMNQLAYLDPFPLDMLSADWLFVPRKRFRFVGAGDNPPHNSYLLGRDCSPGPLIDTIEGKVKYL